MCVRDRTWRFTPWNRPPITRWRAMLDAGIIVTLGTDDPPMFQTNLLAEYERAWEWCDLDLDGVAALARNSIEHSFAAPADKATWLEFDRAETDSGRRC